MATLRAYGFEEYPNGTRFDADQFQDEMIQFVLDYLTPEEVIFLGNTTICTWDDGEATEVKCSGEDTFHEEFGVAMAIINRLFGTRANFLRLVASARHVK